MAMEVASNMQHGTSLPVICFGSFRVKRSNFIASNPQCCRLSRSRSSGYFVTRADLMKFFSSYVHA